MSELTLQFDAGTLVLDGAEQTSSLPTPFHWDERARCWRAPAMAYRQIIEELIRQKTAYCDQARCYQTFQFRVTLDIEPRPYQTEAIARWQQSGRRGVVILPTGAGKSLVAQMAIERVGRSTLIVVPTIDLMNQWYDLLLATFQAEVGLIGGGYFELGALTVTTYASAFRIMERMGNQFGLIIFDECHHLPGSVYRYAAEMAIAPFRLGLTATPERSDGADALLEQLIGPIVYRSTARELAGEYLADYLVERIHVHLSAQERAAYERERAILHAFLDQHGIRLSSLQGWQAFVGASARSEAGRRAMMAYRESKRIALGTNAKLRVLAKLLQRHRRDRVLIFTAENEMVYRIAEQFLIPAITHQTPIKERRHWLHAFNQGDVLALVTSKVLNEGVNIPDASVAVILSGSGSSREHIQRLGRILRKRPDKHAVMYEVVTANTTEERISERRSSSV
ncbi:MAG: DEAD/DEAH box helicase family protein [Acidobacteriota bacterium]|nr:DEAD/DEAH box helicase family protein [Blastocatellia bacterium]MDW8238015.1 DEAD/DEAH box helicase family protein [Acidobacteriota bacterium]